MKTNQNLEAELEQGPLGIYTKLVVATLKNWKQSENYSFRKIQTVTEEKLKMFPVDENILFGTPIFSLYSDDAKWEIA